MKRLTPGFIAALVSLFLILPNPSKISGLKAAGPPAPGGRMFTFEHLTMEEGLSHDVVEAICQDRQGFMWFGTQAGLDRYDGYTIKTYRHDPNDPHSLSSNTGRALYEDRAGNLWVGTHDGGLDRFDPASGGFIHYRNDPTDPHSLSENSVWSIYEDRQGVLWVGTMSQGFNSFEPRHGQI